MPYQKYVVKTSMTRKDGKSKGVAVRKTETTSTTVKTKYGWSTTTKTFVKLPKKEGD